MSVWTCLKCTCRYAVGLLKCPHCEHTEYVVGDAVADPRLMPDATAPVADAPATPVADAPAASDAPQAPTPAAPAPKAKAASKTTT